MLLDNVFKPFIEDKPICVMARAVLLRQSYAGMMVAIPAVYWSVFEGLTDGQMVRVLREMASHVCLDRYRKTPRGPKKPPPPRRRYKNGEHVATSQLIGEHKRR